MDISAAVAHRYEVARERRFGAPNGPEFAEEVEQFLGGDVVAKVFHEECADRHQ